MSVWWCPSCFLFLVERALIISDACLSRWAISVVFLAPRFQNSGRSSMPSGGFRPGCKQFSCCILGLVHPSMATRNRRPLASRRVRLRDKLGHPRKLVEMTRASIIACDLPLAARSSDFPPLVDLVSAADVPQVVCCFSVNTSLIRTL